MSSSSNIRIAILWDMENCSVPSDVRPEDVAGNIRTALQVHPVVNGIVTMFAAYGDFNAFPKRLRQGCQRTGVKLIDVPNGRKDAADKAILVDMFLFALDNPPLSSSIILISGDVDFAPALHVLGQRGYTVIVVIPSGKTVSPALCSAGKFVWDWPSLARGTDMTEGCQINDNVKCENEEESIVYRGSLVNLCNTRSIGSQSLSKSNSGAMSRSVSLPGDLNSLKCQLVKLLKLFGGSLRLHCLSEEYYKLYGVPLSARDYGASKLASLFKKMGDEIDVYGTGQEKMLYLCSSKFSDDERGLGVPNDGSCIFRQSVEKFKCELQEILVSYSCRIFLGCFEAVYQQRYKRQLNYPSYGVSRLEELLEKVRDVAVLQEEPVGDRKFLVAVIG